MRHRHGPAGLRQALGQGRRARAGEVARRGPGAQGRLAVHQPRRSRRLRCGLHRGVQVAVRRSSALPLRHHRLRPARSGPQRPDHLPGRQDPGQALRGRPAQGRDRPRAEGPAGRQDPGLGVREEVRRSAAVRRLQVRRAGHGPDAPGRRRQEAELPRHLLRHVHRLGLRRTVPGQRGPHGPGRRRRPERRPARVERPAAGRLRAVAGEVRLRLRHQLRLAVPAVRKPGGRGAAARPLHRRPAGPPAVRPATRTARWTRRWAGPASSSGCTATSAPTGGSTCATRWARR